MLACENAPRQLSLILLSCQLLCGCNGSDYVPSTDKLLASENPTGFLVADAAHVSGVYGNMDVDCVIYTASYKHPSSENFWKAVAANAANEGWQEIATIENERTFERNDVHGREELRVAYFPEIDNAIIGWIQCDITDCNGKSEIDAAEQNFARTRFWPHFEAIVEKATTEEKVTQ